VVHPVVGVFEQAAQELPLLTRSLLSLSDGIASYGWLAVMGVVVVGIATFFVFSRPGPRLLLDGWLLRLPGVGRLIRARQTASFTRTLAILVSSAVPLVEALKVSSTVIGNRVVAADVSRSAAQVREGMSLSVTLKGVTWLPPAAKRLISGGERSGELAPMLEHAAAIQEDELNAATTVLLAVLQPLLILLVGLMVLYIVLAIMLPILSMSQLLA
jgi:general secretion pathway protein F